MLHEPALTVHEVRESVSKRKKEKKQEIREQEHTITAKAKAQLARRRALIGLYIYDHALSNCIVKLPPGTRSGV